MAMKYVKLFYDWYEMLKELPDEELGIMFRAIMKYGADKTEIPLTGVPKLLFPFFRVNIDRNEEAYNELIKKKSDAGKKSALARQMLTGVNTVNKINKDQDQDQEKEQEQDKDKDQDQYGLGPVGGLGEINKFIKERGLGCDGREFYDYYKSKNWTIGGSPIRDWKAALVSWDKHYVPPAPKPAPKPKPAAEPDYGLPLSLRGTTTIATSPHLTSFGMPPSDAPTRILTATYLKNRYRKAFWCFQP